MSNSIFLRNRSVPIFIGILTLVALAVTFLSPAYGTGALSVSFTKVLGMTLCLCLAALAMDLVWGYCGILSLGHFAFFGLGGYMIGMWLMTARTEAVIRANLAESAIPPTEAEIAANPRARSAKLRIATRTDAPAEPISPQALGLPHVELA
jgi:urea transport system permease protein